MCVKCACTDLHFRHYRPDEACPKISNILNLPPFEFLSTLGLLVSTQLLISATHSTISYLLVLCVHLGVHLTPTLPISLCLLSCAFAFALLAFSHSSPPRALGIYLFIHVELHLPPSPLVYLFSCYSDLVPSTRLRSPLRLLHAVLSDSEHALSACCPGADSVPRPLLVCTQVFAPLFMPQFPYNSSTTPDRTRHPHWHLPG